PGGEGAEGDGDDGDDGGHHAGEDVENGGGATDGEFPGAGDSGGLSPELRPQRYPSPSSLKRQIHNDCMEVNNQLRALITKEIRKPGRHYEKIFHLLKQIQGTLDTRIIFLQNIIKEAARFKKRVLIEQLRNFLVEIHHRANNMNHTSVL
ncbi:hypothetical protein CRUP_007004, partial [Coryphaenoides rupestris]